MDKFFYAFILLLIAQTVLAANPHNYTGQGQIQLIPSISKLAYSPDQKHLVAIVDSFGNNAFIHYYGLRLYNSQPIFIVDGDRYNIKPCAFGFSRDGSWLAVGTSYGAVYVYGFQNNGKLSTEFKYKKYIATDTLQKQIKQISFSQSGLIAIAAKDILVVLQIPNDPQTEFIERGNHTYNTVLSSVAWRHQRQIVIVGGSDTTPVFDIVDINIKPFAPTPIETTSKTSCIGVFPDADQTILQGRPDGDINIYKWDPTNSIYKPDQTIASISFTTEATSISITTDGLYFAANIKSYNKVVAWKSGLTLQPQNHLQNQPQSIIISPILNQTASTFVISNDGNRILLIDATSTKNAQKFSICDQNSWYDNQNKACQLCTNGCGQCFDPDNCATCQEDTKYIDGNNVCQPCSSVTTGCEKCSNNSACTDCNTNGNFNPTPDPTDKTCKCASKFYLNNTECKECNVISFCSECSSSTNCTVCDDQNHIAKDAVDGKCVCENGWYLDTLCKDCTTSQDGCLECKSATFCTKCNIGQFWIVDISGSGKCICNTGYWQNGSSCQPCDTKTDNCTECQQDGVCTKCSNQRVVNPEKTKCICRNHTYEDPTSVTCLVCDNKQQCLHCDSPVNPTDNPTCIECDYIDANRKQQPVNGKCICKGGYTEDDDLKCIPCSIPGCEDCNKQNECSQCFKDKNFEEQPVNLQCVCIAGYIPKKDKQSCSTCQIQIPGCDKCEDLEVCQTCNETNHFAPQPNTDYKCSCIDTYFLKNTSCELCSTDYKNCQLCDKNQCNQCKDGYLSNQNKTQCLTCTEAIPGCSNCTDLKACITCSADKNWELAADNKNCACKLSFYKNGTECKYCAMQYPYCSNCSMEAGCFTCQETFRYNQDLKTCYCPEEKEIKEDGKCEDKSGLSALAIIAIIVGILAAAGAAVAIIKCFKKRQSPLEDGEYEALEAEKNQ